MKNLPGVEVATGMEMFREVREGDAFGVEFTGTHDEANDYVNRTIGTLVMLKTRKAFTPEESANIAASLRSIADKFDEN